MRKVDGSIQRIDDPLDGIGGEPTCRATFFGEKHMLGIYARNMVENNFFRGGVVLGHEVVVTFLSRDAKGRTEAGFEYCSCLESGFNCRCEQRIVGHSVRMKFVIHSHV